MNIVIVEGFLGNAPKKITENTFLLRVGVHENNKSTLWIDGLYFDEKLGLGLSVGNKVLINGRLGSIKEGQKSPLILVDSIEVK